eukprot:18803-Pelagococcus_subviridis.AAC.5
MPNFMRHRRSFATSSSFHPGDGVKFHRLRASPIFGPASSAIVNECEGGEVRRGVRRTMKHDDAISNISSGWRAWRASVLFCSLGREDKAQSTDAALLLRYRAFLSTRYATTTKSPPTVPAFLLAPRRRPRPRGRSSAPPPRRGRAHKK